MQRLLNQILISLYRLANNCAAYLIAVWINATYWPTHMGDDFWPSDLLVLGHHCESSLLRVLVSGEARSISLLSKHQSFITGILALSLVIAYKKVCAREVVC